MRHEARGKRRDAVRDKGLHALLDAGEWREPRGASAAGSAASSVDGDGNARGVAGKIGALRIGILVGTTSGASPHSAAGLAA